MWGRLKAALIVITSVGALGAAAVGIYCAFHSSLFTVRVVEVADQAEGAPVEPQTIERLAAIPVGKVNLFDLGLKDIEKRILQEPWIREVRIQKRFPQTVSISVSFREPRAIAQLEHGKLAYVDPDGTVFGQVDLTVHPDLPILTGGKIPEALRILDAWNKAGLGDLLVSSMTYDEERGFRALVTYPMNPPAGKGRAMVEFGHDLEKEMLSSELSRLKQVFRYLADHRVQARQIFADAGKKIVVKIARGS